MNNWYVKVLQRDIVTDPEQWKDAGPGKFIKLTDKAKNVYCVLSVIAFSQAGNDTGKVVQGGMKLGSDWFYASHSMLRQLTGSGDKTVQRGISELKEKGFIGYYPAKAKGQKCYFKIKRIKYNIKQESVRDVQFKPKAGEKGNHKPPTADPSRQNHKNKKEVVQDKPVELHIPYKGEGKLFQRGDDTHDDRGQPINTNGKQPEAWDFTEADTAMEKDGEMAFFKTVAERNIENHLTPKYRKKFDELKNVNKLPVFDEVTPDVPEPSKGLEEVEIPF